MKLTEHLEHVIGLVERHAPYLEIKRSLLGMHEEVSGTEQAASKTISIAEKEPALPNLKAEEILSRLIELQNSVNELKQQLQKRENAKPEPPRWA